MDSTHDEKEGNLEWLQAAYELCMTSIEAKEFTRARAIAADMKDASFDSDSRVMTWEIEKAEKGLEAAVVEVDFTK